MLGERIDANLMNVSMDDLMNMPKDMYEKRMGKLKEKVKGKLIIKEYPTASANPAHFRALLNDLALKKNFKPDIIFVDYLNICASARIKAGIAWAALWSADNRLRNALKHLDDPEQFRDAMIEVRELIQDALGKIDE